MDVQRVGKTYIVWDKVRQVMARGPAANGYRLLAGYDGKLLDLARGVPRHGVVLQMDGGWIITVPRKALG